MSQPNLKPNPLRDLKSYVLERIETLVAAKKDPKRWADCLLLLNEVVAAWNTKNDRLRAQKTSFDAAVLDAQQSADANAKLESELELLRNQLEDMRSELETKQYKYKVPRPACVLLANVDAGYDIFLVESDPEHIESRMEFVNDPKDGVIGVAVWVDHSIKPYYFPFGEAITPLESARGEYLDTDNNPEHALLVYQSGLQLAVDFADSMTEKYGPLLGLREITGKTHDDSTRLYGTATENVPMHGSNAAPVTVDTEIDDEEMGSDSENTDPANVPEGLDINDEDEDEDIIPESPED